MRLSRRIRLWRKLSSISDIRKSSVLLGRENARRAGEIVFLRLKPMFGERVACRIGTTDMRTLFDTFVKNYHAPPVKLDTPGCILDLGSNVGFTAAHFACLYPSARIVAVEMDADNCRLAAENTYPWRDRVKVIHAAVWSKDGVVSYEGDEEDGYAVSGWISDISASDAPWVVRSRSIRSIINELGIKRVDDLKMDMEGAENEVLLASDPDWLECIDSIKVEIHNGQDMTPYAEVLNRAGFRCWKDTKHWSAICATRASS